MPDPVNVTPPVITGNTVVGSTLSASEGTWTNSPTSFTYQWLRETGPATGVYAAITDQTGATYRQVTADVDRRIECTVEASNVVPSSPWLGWTIPAVPGGATAVTTGAQLTSILQGGGVAGTNYDATGLTASFSDRFQITGRYASETKVWLGPNVKFLKSQLLTDTGVDVIGAKSITIYGGDITNPVNGNGILLRPSNTTKLESFKWWGFLIHNVGQQGLACFQTTFDVDGVDIRGEITAWGQNLSIDPHNTKGSGQHGCYLGHNPVQAGRVRNSLFVLHIHDGQYGGGAQLGPALVNTEIQVQAERLMYNPPAGADGTGGNVAQIFGDSQSNLVISYLEGDTVRTGVFIAGGTAPLNQIQVTHARCTNARVGTSLTSRYQDYPASSRIIYSDTV